MLRHIERLIGVRAEARLAPWRLGDQPWYVSDTAAFEAATGWRARVDLDTGLQCLCNWLKRHVVRPPAAVEDRLEVHA
jgi:CDP-paratose 2-epimerase